MESSDDDFNTRLSIGLGFRELSSGGGTINQRRPSTDQKDDRSFPSLSLGLSYRSSASKFNTGKYDFGELATADVNREVSISYSNCSGSATRLERDREGIEKTLIVSDEDEDYCSTPTKKLRLSKEEISILEGSFKCHTTINPKQKEDLARQLRVRPRQVEVWFQNRRARIKLKQTEIDRETLRRRCETLSEENRRLQEEVEELKSRTQQAENSTPFLVKIGPSTNIMCPSCKRIEEKLSDGFPTSFLISSSTRKVAALQTT